MKVQLRHRKGRKVEYLDSDGKWKTTGKDTKRDALAWWETERTAKRGLLFKEIAEDFYTSRSPGSYLDMRSSAGRDLSPRTIYIRNKMVQNYLIPEYGEMEVKNINTILIQKRYVSLMNKCGTPASSGTKELYRTTLSSIMKYLVMMGAISFNPCDNMIRVGHKKVYPKKAFTTEEIERLFPEDHEKLLDVWEGDLVTACFFMILLDTGWRPGEAAGLTPSCYSPEHRGIYTFKSLDSFTRSIKESIKTTDHGYDFKIGILSERTADILIYLCKGKKENETIFITKTGKYFTTSYTNSRLPKALKRAGIDPEGHPPYSFRTTFMTRLSMVATDSVVMRLMGHTQWHTCYDKRTPLDMLEKAKRELADNYRREELNGDVVGHKI